MEQHLRLQLEDLYPVALRMAVYHLGRREEPYLFEQSTLVSLVDKASHPKSFRGTHADFPKLMANYAKWAKPSRTTMHCWIMVIHAAGEPLNTSMI